MKYKAVFLRIVVSCCLLSCASPKDTLTLGSTFPALESTLSACESRQIPVYLNDPELTVQSLVNANLDYALAESLTIHRNGPDGVVGTTDDQPYLTLEDLTSIDGVTEEGLSQLASAVASHCAIEIQHRIIFSPQPYAQSHLKRFAELVDQAEHTIDIAMYSFGDAQILAGLGRAHERGVSIRFVYDGADKDADKPDGSTSQKIEELGIDVRYVNKIMHHKFAIFDGPRDSLGDAFNGTLFTGSANLSYWAGTRYDENTIVLSGMDEALLRFQREFNLLWQNSRDFIGGADPAGNSGRQIEEWMIADHPAVDARFTSANFRVSTTASGPTFSVVSGRNEVANALVQLIDKAQHSILLASGHLRSRPVAEALVRAHQRNPRMDIRIYLDSQEYIAKSTHEQQIQDMEDCLGKAGASVSKQQACYDKGFYFSYLLYQEGIPVRFKTFAYHWHLSYAVQMHHKYFVIDGQLVASGSYNLSDNAEHNTIENMAIYQSEEFRDAVNSFTANFEEIWKTGEEEARFDHLLAEIQSGSGPIPLVFPSVALTQAQVTYLKALLYRSCPLLESEEYRLHPERHLTCPRG